MLCLNCFHRYSKADQCPKCGWNEEKMNPEGTLPLGKILADRYQIGGVLHQKGERTAYCCWDSNERRVIELTEIQAKHPSRWKKWGGFLYEGKVYAVNPPEKLPKKKWPAVAVLILLLGIGGAGLASYLNRPVVWLPKSALSTYEQVLKEYRITAIPDEEYTSRLKETSTMPDVFYREGYSGNLNSIAKQIDFETLGEKELSKAYPSGLEMPTGWYATVAFTHTKKETVTPEQLFSGKERVCVAEDNWDDLMRVWTEDYSGTTKELNQVISVYKKQRFAPHKDNHTDWFTAKKIDWLIDDTLERGYLTRFGSMISLEQQGKIAGCYGAHWCLGTEDGYEILKLLLSDEAQSAVFADSKLLPLSENALKQVIEQEPSLRFLLKKERVLFGENRAEAYQENNIIYKKITESLQK